MQFVAEPRPSGAGNLLGVPGLGSGDVDADDDDCDVVIGIRPKSSPLPRRRTSESDEDTGPELPPSRSRRVSFADAEGLSLVCVKEFDQWDIPKLPGYESLEGKGTDAEEYYICPLFSLSLSPEELLRRVHEQRLELETIELLPGTTVLKGLIRVLNITFDKKVYVRTTLDTWASHFDLLAEYIPGSSDGVTDCFSFKLTLVPPFGEQGARVDFCLRYETPVGTFWCNNGDRNYVVFCHQRVKEMKEKQQKENVLKKSCLKAASQNFAIVETWPSLENLSSDVSTYGEEVAGRKAQHICDSKSGTTEEDCQKIQVENSRNYSRGSRQRAARLARVRDYFSERDGDANNKESKASTTETSQITQRENTLEMHSNGSETQSHPVEYSESGGSEVIQDSMVSSSKLSSDVQHETSPVQRTTSNKKSEKSKTINSLLNSVTSKMAVQDTAAIPNNLSNSKVQPVFPFQNLNDSVSNAEEKRQKQMESNRGDMIDESTCTTNTESKSDSNVRLLEPIEGFGSHTNSFTFETVVAPLYHQVVGRAESESQNLADHGNPVRGRLNKRDSSSTCTAQNYLHPERSEICSSVSADASRSRAEIPGDSIETQESDQRCIGTSKEPKPISEEIPVCGHPRILNTDLLRAHIPRESSHLQGKAQDDNLIHDLQHNNPFQAQTTVETAQTQPPEDTSPHMKTLDAAVSQAQTQTDATSAHAPFLQAHVSPFVSLSISAEMDKHTSSGGLIDHECIDESKEKEDIHTTTTAATTGTNSEWDKPLEDSDTNLTIHSTARESENSTAGHQNTFVSSAETVEEKRIMEEDINNTTEQTSLEGEKEQNKVEMGHAATDNFSKEETRCSVENEDIGDLITTDTRSGYHTHADVTLEFKDKDALEEEPAVMSEKEGFAQVKNMATRQEDIDKEETAEERNWEKMVEEEEVDVLNDEQGSEEIGNKEEMTKELLEEQGLEKGEMELEGTEEEDRLMEVRMVEEIVVGEEEEELEEEEEVDEGDIAGMKEEEDIQWAEDQEEEETEWEEQMEIYMFEGEEDIGVEWEEVEPMEEDMEGVGGEEEEEEEERITEQEEEMEISEVGETKVVGEKVEEIEEDVEIENSEGEVGVLEQRSDAIQNKAEDELSTPVNNVHERVSERVSDIENKGEEANVCITDEIHLYTEEEEDDDQGNNNTTNDRRKATNHSEREENKSTTAEGELCILTDDSDRDQTGEDSASTDSLSDDEVELYMHCLRAVQKRDLDLAARDHSKDLGLSVVKRPSIVRGKQLPSPMPSISESVDEDHPSIQDYQADMETLEFQPTTTQIAGQESITRNVAWWKETFSCSNISKALFFTILLVVFFVVAYQYDFLACFALYLFSVFWLCCQGEKKPVKNNNRFG